MTSIFVAAGRGGAILVLLGAALGSAPVSADETGLAGLHDWRREGRRVCFSDHFHSGSGSGATKVAAENDAVGSWASFTAAEYGTAWASFRNAASKSVACEKAGGGGYSCQLSARPCK